MQSPWLVSAAWEHSLTEELASPPANTSVSRSRCPQVLLRLPANRSGNPPTAGSCHACPLSPPHGRARRGCWRGEMRGSFRRGSLPAALLPGSRALPWEGAGGSKRCRYGTVSEKRFLCIRRPSLLARLKGERKIKLAPAQGTPSSNSRRASFCSHVSQWKVCLSLH